MKIIACIDDHFGLMFNKRRVSQDIEIRKDILLLNETIYMNQYSYELMKDTLDNVVVDEDFLDKADDHYCFIENVSVKDRNVEEIILYYFNRVYPSDFSLDIDLSQYHKVEEIEFEGKSHHIKKEVYKKNA